MCFFLIIFETSSTNSNSLGNQNPMTNLEKTKPKNQQELETQKEWNIINMILSNNIREKT